MPFEADGNYGDAGVRCDRRLRIVGPMKDRHEKTEGDPAGPTAKSNLSRALLLVRQGSAGIDRAWNEARMNESDRSLTIALGEASHSLHRALIVLADPTPISDDHHQTS